MTYERFEDLPVWQASADLAARMFDWTTHAAFRRKGDLANQLQRAALSVSNNIAEGFERGSTNELLQFLYIARGSAGEVRSMLCVMDRMPSFADLKSEISNLKSQSEAISRQIRGWAASLQNSDIPGQRQLNDQTRRVFDQQKRRTAFQEQLDEQQRQREARWEAERQAAREAGEPKSPKPDEP